MPWASCPAPGIGAGARGSLAASPPEAVTPEGCCPSRPRSGTLSSPSSLGLSGQFVPRQGCGAACQSCLVAGGGDGAAAPAAAISWGPRATLDVPMGFLQAGCSLDAFFLLRWELLEWDPWDWLRKHHPGSMLTCLRRAGHQGERDKQGHV